MMKGVEGKGYFLIDVGEFFNVKCILEVKGLIEQAIQKGFVSIVFDLSTCQQMDSSAIGLLTNLGHKLSLKKGKIGFLRPSKAITDLVTFAGLEETIGIYRTEADL